MVAVALRRLVPLTGVVVEKGRAWEEHDWGRVRIGMGWRGMPGMDWSRGIDGGVGDLYSEFVVHANSSSGDERKDWTLFKDAKLETTERILHRDDFAILRINFGEARKALRERS